MKYKLIFAMLLVAIGSLFTGSYDIKFINQSIVIVPKPVYVKSKKKGW